MPFSDFERLLKKVGGANSVKEARKWIEHHPDALPEALRAMSARARYKPQQVLSILYVANDFVQHVLDRHARSSAGGGPWASEPGQKVLWQASIGEVIEVCVGTESGSLPRGTHENAAKLLHTWLRKKAFDEALVSQWHASITKVVEEAHARGEDGSSGQDTERPRKRSKTVGTAGTDSVMASEQGYRPSPAPSHCAPSSSTAVGSAAGSSAPRQQSWRQDVHSFVMCKFIADLCSDLNFPQDRLGLVQQTAHVYFHLWFHQIEKEKHKNQGAQKTQATGVGGGAWGGMHGYAVATTCVLLASKQEDSPKRLSTLVTKLGRRLPRSEFNASQKRALQHHDEALRNEQRLLAAWRQAPEGSKQKEENKLKWQDARCTCSICSEIIRLELELLYGLGFDTAVTHPMNFWFTLLQPLFAKTEAEAEGKAEAEAQAERLKQASWEMVGLASHTSASIRYGIHNVACASLMVAAVCTGTESALPENWITKIAIPIYRRAGGGSRHPLTLENVDKASEVLQRFLDWWQQQQPTSSEKRRKSALFSPRTADAAAGRRATPSQPSTSSSSAAHDAASSSSSGSSSTKLGAVSSLDEYRERKRSASDASRS